MKLIFKRANLLLFIQQCFGSSRVIGNPAHAFGIGFQLADRSPGYAPRRSQLHGEWNCQMRNMELGFVSIRINYFLPKALIGGMLMVMLQNIQFHFCSKIEQFYFQAFSKVKKLVSCMSS